MIFSTAACAGLSRRSVVGLLATGAGFVLLPYRIGAATSVPRAIAFDGDALVTAIEGEIRRFAPVIGWQVLKSPGFVTALASLPARPGEIVAGLAGGGIARSSDGGSSWQFPGKGLPGAPVTALAASAAAPDTLYAAVAGDGLWHSTDNGAVWSLAMDRPWIGDGEREIVGLASVNTASGMGGIWIYAATEAGLIRVPDCFCRWQAIVAGDAMDALIAGGPQKPEAPLPKGEAVRALASCLAESERLFAAMPSGLWTSADAGVNWSRSSELNALALASHPQNPEQLAAVTKDAVVVSRDGGTNWTKL